MLVEFLQVRVQIILHATYTKKFRITKEIAVKLQHRVRLCGIQGVSTMAV
jgi:hypothetical protein